MKLPKVDLYISPKNAWIESIVEFVSDEVSPDERLFVYGNEAYYYFLSGRFYVWPFLQLYPGQVGGDGGKALAQLLRSKPPTLIVRGIFNWPGVPQLSAYAPILHQYIGSHFEPDERVFRRHPPRAGGKPPAWVASVLRPRDVDSKVSE